MINKEQLAEKIAGLMAEFQEAYQSEQVGCVVKFKANATCEEPVDVVELTLAEGDWDEQQVWEHTLAWFIGCDVDELEPDELSGSYTLISVQPIDIQTYATLVAVLKN